MFILGTWEGQKSEEKQQKAEKKKKDGVKSGYTLEYQKIRVKHYLYFFFSFFSFPVDTLAFLVPRSFLARFLRSLRCLREAF